MTHSLSVRQHESLPLDNDQVAGRLNEVADLLEAQGANVFRIRAYRTAAETLRNLEQHVHEIVIHEGLSGLIRLRGIGRSLATSIEQLTRTGRLGLLNRLRGEEAAERLFATVPNIGPKMAELIHEHLGIETLGELEIAANDGRLAEVPGMGAKRVRGVRESIAGRFRHGPTREAPRRPPPADQPPVEELLDIDRQYRHMVELDRLPKIAPRRFNPTSESWLPILHTQRDDRHFTALYSNTARAHELGTTHDWVVIYRDDHDGHGQWTVITAGYGKLRGQRIVRGREAACREYYDREQSQKTPRGNMSRRGGQTRRKLSK